MLDYFALLLTAFFLYILVKKDTIKQFFWYWLGIAGIVVFLVLSSFVLRNFDALRVLHFFKGMTLILIFVGGIKACLPPKPYEWGPLSEKSKEGLKQAEQEILGERSGQAPIDTPNKQNEQNKDSTEG